MLSTLHLYLTLGCNLNCEHCWISAGQALNDELTTKEVYKIISDASELCVKYIKITGGEPFTRADLPLIASFANRKRINLTIETNGTLLDENTARKLQALKVRLIISVDGHNEDEHDLVRGRGSFKKVINGIALLHKYNVGFGINTIATKRNQKNLLDLIDKMFAMGAETCRIGFSIQAVGRGKGFHIESLGFNEVAHVMDVLRSTDYWRKNQVTTTLPLALDPRFSGRNCGFGAQLCCILSNGSVAPCGIAYEAKELIAGNVRSTPLKEIWGKSPLFGSIRAFQRKDFKGICGHCLLWSQCRGGCRASAYLDSKLRSGYGDLLAPYTLCQTFYEAGLFPQEYIADLVK